MLTCLGESLDCEGKVRLEGDIRSCAPVIWALLSLDDVRLQY